MDGQSGQVMPLWDNGIQPEARQVNRHAGFSNVVLGLCWMAVCRQNHVESIDIPGVICAQSSWRSGTTEYSQKHK